MPKDPDFFCPSCGLPMHPHPTHAVYVCDNEHAVSKFDMVTKGYYVSDAPTRQLKGEDNE